MGLMDNAKDKLGDSAGQHGDKLGQGVEKGGDFVDQKTGGQHADKVDQAQDAIGDRLGGGADNPPADTPQQ